MAFGGRHRSWGWITAAAAVVALAAPGCGHHAPPPAPVTFDKDVAPIVFANCAPCHRPGEVAPFSVLSYAEAAPHAEDMADETLQHRMPPWLPDRGDYPIVGERRLTAAQIDTIQRWVKSGKPEGNPADLPAVPVFPGGWQLGKPDVILRPAHAYTLRPGGDDVYRNLVIHTSLASGVFVRALEFKTGGAPIHHAVIRVDTSGMMARQDGQDGQPGVDGMAWQAGQDPEGHFIGWAPGRGPILSPDGMPWRLDRGADLVVELHLLPGKKPIEVQPTVALFLTDTPPVATPLTLKMSSRLIDIPPGATDYLVIDTFKLPAGVDLLSVYPHAHYLGKDMLVTATLPDGGVKTLLHIPQWSFHWQQDYRYVTPISLPAGTTMAMRYTYDNSAANPENPRRPPVRVRLGPQSTDEMAELGLQVLAKSLADEAALVQALVDHDTQANVVWAEQQVREAPNVAHTQAVLGSAYVQTGRFADAVPPLETALRLDGRSAETEGDLGSALFGLGRIDEALAHLRRAAALSPQNESIQFNLGNALNRSAQPEAAAEAYARAIAINPEFPDPHANLGALLVEHGHAKEAVPHFVRAVELRPNSAVLHTDLASALAASGQFAAAMQQVRRALELNPSYAPALDDLRRLQQMGIK
jgi:tetratricopeptide (TPR) repeat protein/mono/diheme cytochrome c family protein